MNFLKIAFNTVCKEILMTFPIEVLRYSFYGIKIVFIHNCNKN